MTSRYSGFFVEVDAQRQRCGVAPLPARNSQRSPLNACWKCSYASFAFAIASLPRSASASSVPIASRRLSASVSTRETKKLATECTFVGSPPPSTSRSSPRRYASTTSRVALQREDERDVDALAVRDAVLDRAEAGLRRRDLHVEVRPVDPLVQAHRLVERRLACRRRASGRPPSRRSRPARCARAPARAGRARVSTSRSARLEEDLLRVVSRARASSLSCSSYASPCEIAFWKIVGFDVTPTTASSSIIRFSSPGLEHVARERSRSRPTGRARSACEGLDSAIAHLLLPSRRTFSSLAT